MPLTDLLGLPKTGSSPDTAPLGSAGIRPLATVLGGAPDVPTVTPAPTNDLGIQKYANLSANVGGGAYAVGATPTQLIKSPRDLQSSFASRAKVRGGYTGSAVGIDHIVPVALGGKDALDNIQLLPKKQFDTKTIVDNLAYFLYDKGKISLAVARNLDKNWNNNPTALIDVDALKNDPSLANDITFSDGTKFNIHDALSKLPKPVDQVTPGDVVHEVMTEGPKLAGNAFFDFFKNTANLANKYIGGPLYGAAQSVLRGQNFSQATKQYQDLVDSGQMEKATGISNPFDRNTNIALEPAKGLLTSLSLGFLKPDIGTYDTGTKQFLAKGLNMLGNAAGTVMGYKAISNLAARYLPEVPGLTALTEKVANTSIGKAIASSPYVSNLLKDAGVFGLQGQLSAPIASSLEQRSNQLMHDVTNAFIFNTAGSIINAKLPPVKSGEFNLTNITAGTLANAYAGYAISRWDGASRPDAALNGAIFGILHGYGLKENEFALKAEKQAQTASIDQFRQLGVEGKLESTSQLDKAVTTVRSTLAQEVANGTMTHAEAVPVLQDAITAAKYLNRQNLPLRSRIKSDLSDMATVFMSSRAEGKNEELPATQNTAKIDPQARQFMGEVQNTPAPVTEIPTSEAPVTSVADTATPNAQVVPEAQDRFMTTGMAKNINSITNRNHTEIQTALENGQKVDISLVRRPDHPQDPNAVQVVGSIDNGPVKLLGYVPTERNITENQNPVWADKPEAQFNPATNNTTLAQEMDKNGLHAVRVKANLETAGVGVKSGQPYMIMSVPQENWNEAIQKKSAQAAPQAPVQYNNRQELFDRLPPTPGKAVTDREFLGLESFARNNDAKGMIDHLNEFGKVADLSMGKMVTDNMDKVSYFDIYKMLATAEADRTLNAKGQMMLDGLRTGLDEFSAVHGRDALKQLLSSPINKGLPPGEPAPIKPVEQPQVAPTVTAPVAEFKNVGKIPGTRQDIFINKAVFAGKQPISDGDFSTFGGEQRLTGIAKQANNKIIDLINDGASRNDPRIQKIYAWTNRNTNRDYIRSVAARTPDQAEFVNNYVKSAEQLGFEPFSPAAKGQLHHEGLYGKFDENELQDFKKLYVKLRQTPADENEFVTTATPTGMGIKETQTRAYEPKSYIMERASKAGLDLRNINMDESDYQSRQRSEDKVIHELAENLDKNGYIFLGNPGQKVENSMALKYDSPEAKEMIAKFDPKKHAPDNDDVIAAWKDLGGNPANPTDKEKLLMVFATDVLHLDKNTSAPEFYKRLNILGDRSVKWDQEGTFRNYVFPGTKLRDVMEQAFPGKVKDTPQMKEFLDRVSQDGAIFMFPEDMDQVGFDLGFKGKSWNKKGSIVSEMPDGTLLVQKGNTGTMNDLLQGIFEKELGLKLKGGRDMVSFGENIKIGKSGLIPTETNPQISYADIPKKDMRFAYKNPKDDLAGSFGVHLLGKFSKADGINEELVNIFQPGAKKWMDTINRIVLNGESMNAVLKENYGKVPEESEFGKLKTMFAQNADKISLEKQFNNVMTSLFQDTVVRNRNLRSAYMTIIPDMGYKKDGQLTMLQPDEIMMSREAADNLKLQPSEDGNTYVLTAREPVTDKLAMSKQKVIIADNYGIKTLGKDDIIPNLFDIYARKEGDYDGDGIMIYALIDKNRQNQLLKDGKSLDGIPEEVANNIEMDRMAQGKESITSGIESKKWPKYPITPEGLLKIAEPASLAKKELGGISNFINIGKLLVDNQKSFTLTNKDGTKVVNPNMDGTTISNTKQLIQEALDAGKSPTFADRNVLQRNPLYYMFHLSSPNDIFSLTSQLYNPQENYMGAFQTLSKSYPGLEGYSTPSGSFVPGLKDTINAFNRTVPQDPSQWHPIQTLFQGLQDIPSFTANNKMKWDSDRFAREEFTKKVEEPTMTPEAKDFLNFVNNRRQQAQATNDQARAGDMDRDQASDKMKQLRQDIYEKYNAELHNYTKKDLDAISWHMIADNSTNWYFDPRYEDRNNKVGWMVERFNDLFQPDQSKVYYKARDEWFDENVKKPLMGQFPGLSNVLQNQNPTGNWVPAQQFNNIIPPPQQ